MINNNDKLTKGHWRFQWKILDIKFVFGAIQYHSEVVSYVIVNNDSCTQYSNL